MKCGEIFLGNGKAYQCQQTRYTEHSHQDHTLKQQVKRGEMKVVPLTPKMVLEDIEKAFEVNATLNREDIIEYICKAIKKPYKKKNYVN